MRLRQMIWIAACLLLLAGACLLWRAHNHRNVAKNNPRRNVVTTVHSTSTAPQFLVPSPKSTNAMTATLTRINPLAYQLHNTSRTIDQLATDPHAILLENALIDSRLPLNFNFPKQLQSAGDPGAYIVQSRAPVDASFHNLVQASGARIISYIPNDALLISAPSAIVDLLRAQPMVQAVIPYEPYYKIQPTILGAAVNQNLLPSGAVLTLGLFPSSATETISQIEKLGAQIVSQDNSPFGPVVRVLPPANWTALADLPGVQIVEPYRQRVEANDLSRATLGVSQDTQNPTNYLGLDGSGVTVAVIDTGVDAQHPDFGLRILGLNPIDLVDTNGHGTFVAGQIAGNGSESMTVNNAEGSIMTAVNGQFRGMATNADIFSMSFGGFYEGNVLDHDISRILTDGARLSDTNFQMQAALTNALISNNSWDYSGDSVYDLAAASYDAATRDALPTVTGPQPVLFVFSAGNDGGGTNNGIGGNADTILSPATAKNVLTVGAIEQLRDITNIVTDVNSNQTTPWEPVTDSSGQVAAFSARGNVGIGFEGKYGRYKPDVVAPGTFVISTRSEQWNTNAYYNPTNDNRTQLADALLPGTETDPAMSFNVPNNTVQVNVNTVGTTNNSFDTTLTIAVTPGNLPPVTGINSLSFPPNTLSPLNYIWSAVVTNDTSSTLFYTLTADVLTTNDLGNYYDILRTNLNDEIGPWYRYETGTSMSAADVSGMLALMQEYLTNAFGIRPSPVLLKAMLINGASAGSGYDYNITNAINYEGWGVPNLPNSLPTGITNVIGQSCDDFFVDQSPTNALATGDSHTYIVTLDTNSFANYYPLQVTLAWTDPPGNPVADIKLVNSLELIVTNLDDPDNEVYYGNDIPAGETSNTPENATNTVPVDNINNVQQVIVSPPLGGGGSHYSITVIGKAVNVNAVYEQTNNIVQDYALVVSCSAGQVPMAFTLVQDNPIAHNSTGSQDVTYVTVTNTPLFDQMVGASSPLLATNQIDLGTNLLYGTNGLITLGQTNQWHFYIVTNTGPAADFTNAAFITFLPDTLALPRTGVYADSDANSTRPEADIDLYVTTNSAITNLDPTLIANADKSLGRGGTEFVTYTNSAPGDIYYVGVKSEDQMASEYAFIPIFTDIPFGQSNSNGDQVINGLNVPVNIPDGSPSHPGVGYVFAIGLQQEEIRRVVVTNIITHQNFGDLVGVLSHSDQKGGNVSVTLNSHDEPSFPPPPGPYTNIYDDSGQNDILNSRTTDGPGSLKNYAGGEALGVWILSEVDNSQTQTGRVDNLQLLVEKRQDPTQGITVSLPPNSWFYTFIDVPAGFTNLQLFGTNLSPAYVSGNIGMYLRYNADPDLNIYDLNAFLTNASAPGTFGGGEISDGPPLTVGRYFIGLFNSDSVAHTVFLLAHLNGSLENIPFLDFTTNGGTLFDDAITNSTIYVPATNLIAEVNVGIIAEHPRISDLSFTLISPTGQRILLMEDRGGPNTQNIGHLNVLTNYFGTTQSGNALAATNVVGPVPTQGTLLVDYNFFTVPDTIDIYYDGAELPGFPQTLNLVGTLTVPYGPGNSTNITIVMNAGGNPSTTLWTYTPRVEYDDYNYLTFTEDTNLTQIPIKYAIPPYDLEDEGTNFALSNFETNTAGDYFGPTNIFDAFGGWTVPTNILSSTNAFTNFVSVVTDPHDAFVSANTNLTGTNILALANGYILRTNALTLERTYSFTYQYRGPGIVGWWRGEGDATDNADPERLGQNGTLIGQFDFPAGEVGQAFEFEDAGANFEFAGTNTYVQIRQQPTYTLTVTNESSPAVLLQSTPLDVGAGGGLTVDAWVNPTNIAHQMPLVEWLARVPTNGSDTNLFIVAGPFLDLDTSHYYYLLSATNWTVSERWATQLGGHLATVDTANEENWIFDSFADYGFTNRNLWIGLTNNNATTFSWSDGNTNLIYTNWANGQPNNCDSTRNYTFITGPTNAQPGLWMLGDNNGFACDGITYTNLYGVVEVPNLQTNGVQLWISVTNYIGMTNAIVDGFGNLYSNGCIYANLVDTSDSNHIFFSQPLLIQTNVYQHVALTYDTNSGIANLFYNGTNVATTNFGTLRLKTTGDVLLGKDMSLLTNNYYGGMMDEISIYNRALSDAEILAIYNDSAQASNGMTGKFDPAQSPPGNLAEALVNFGGNTNVIFGNNSWQTGGFTFVAQTNSIIMQLLGLEPGILLDNFTISESPIGNLYYFPEQSLDDLKSTDPNGDWTLEVWDNRIGAVATNALISWQLQFILASNPPPVVLEPEEPANITVPPGGFAYLTIAVPDWASFATNILVSASAPVDMWFNPTNPPTENGAGDFQLLLPSTSGIGSPVLSAGSIPPLPPDSYYLGIHNNGPHAVSATVEVDFDITVLSNGVPVTEFLNTNQSGRYFAFDVDSNAYEATFQLLQVSNNVDLVVRKSFPLPTLTSDDYGSFNVANSDENIFVLTNSSPVPLSAGRWYIGAFKRTAGVPANFTVLAKELTNDLSPQNVSIIPLTNGVPYTFNNEAPGAALTNFFLFAPTNQVVVTTNGLATNFVQAVRFEVYDMNGNGDLTVQTNAPPFAPPFFQSSQNPGTQPELIMIYTNNVLTNLATQWYLGVPNNETNPINFTIIASVETNAYFPAFPGAEGVGGGALGGDGAWRSGLNNRVYHVINLNDSGSGSLRDAVSSTNRTIVFDVSGILFLQSPLVITNSYLTIAGQTAPGGGVTVAGYMTELANLHDVIIRDVRFFTGGAFTNAGWSTDFEGANSADYITNQTFNNFTVSANQVSVVTDPTNAYHGSNFLALANGTISSSLPTRPGQTYQLSFAYRGPGAVSLWRGENNGNDSISGNNPTTVNNIAYTNGMVGKAIVFNGSSSYIHYPASASLNVGTNSSGFTIDTWMDPVTPDPHIGIMFEWNAGFPAGDDSPVGVHMSDGSSQADTLYANVKDNTGPNSPHYVRSTTTLTFNGFQHVTLTYNKRNGFAAMYRNGVAMTNFFLGIFTPQTSYPLNIGYRADGNFQGSYFFGYLDEPTLYGRPLSASEVKAIYQKGSAGKYDTNAASIALGLAKAQVSVNGASQPAFYGNNTNWQTTNITFTATQYGTPLQITGLEPGMLLDSFSLAAVDTNTFAIATNGDALEFNNVSNVIADHISALWSTNADLEILNSTNVTTQWSVISDSLNTNSMHGYGARVRYGGGTVSLHHNLFADNAYASPRLGDNIGLDFVNNVVYDWGTNSGFSTNELVADDPNGFTNELNYICNYLIASTNSLTNTIAFWGGTTNTWIFQTNNFIDSNTNGILDGADTGWGMFTNKYTKFDRPFPTVLPAIDEAFLAYEKVLDFAGPDMDKRDWADTNIISNVRTQTGQIISTRPSLGLVAWWKGEGNYNDSAGTNNGYLNAGTITFVPAKVGQGFSFDGGTNQILVNDAPQLNFGANQDFSIDAWIEPQTNAANINGVMSIVDKRIASGFADSPNGYEFSLQDGRIHCRFLSNGFGGVGPDMRDGHFHHVALSVKRNSATGGQLYQDGVVVNTFSTIGLSGSLTNTQPLHIGNHAATNYNGYFKGLIDEVQLYNRALSASEIQSIYAVGSAGEFYTDVTPFLDTDQDGIPDFWETTFGSNPFVPNPNSALDGSGYTELEEYMNWLAAPHALTITNTLVGVDLQQMFGQTGNLSFSVTNAVNGSVYLTNVLNYTNVSGTAYAVTNTGAFSNAFAIFTPTNSFNGTVTNYGYASFDVYVTNNDTIAHFGPVTVSVVVSAKSVRINSNMPPVITVLTNGVLDPTNYGGTDFYQFTISDTNATGIQFDVTNINPAGSANLVVAYNRLPSLSDYDYINTNSAFESVVVWTNSTPVPLTNGIWYAGVVNVDPNGNPVSYDIEASEYLSVYPPLFIYPTNNVFTNIETTLFTLQCQAVDTNSPAPLPLTFSLASGPTNMVVSSAGAISWTPTEAQGPSTNTILVSVSNGRYAVTNSFTVIVQESNLPPFWPASLQTNYTITAYDTLTVIDTATDTDIPVNPLTYTNFISPAATNIFISTNNIITWSPTLAQTGAIYTVETIVTDTNRWAINSKSLSNTNYIFITVLPLANLNPTSPQTNFVNADSIDWFEVDVPSNAIAATNILLYATNLPVNVWFSTNLPPTITNASDALLLANVTNGSSVLTTNSTPALVDGGTYYLGVQNTNSIGVGFAVAVNFEINPVPVTVSFSSTNSGLPLNPAFVGLSYEKSILTGNLFTTNDTNMINILGQIAPAVLRIGGNSVNRTGWNGFMNTVPITTNEVDAFADFVNALPAGWKVIYGIDMASNTPVNCAAEAAYVANALGSRLLGFEIGNEPDLYSGNGLRPGYTYSDFIAEWRTFAAAITNAVPGWAVTNGGNGWTLTGPASAGNTFGYTIPFAGSETGIVSMLTQHYYRANGQSPSSTLQFLLQPDPNLPGTVSNLVAAATTNNLPLGFRMDECGSFYNGGAPNVSDAYGTALWSLDYMFTLALNGCQGLNFHGGGQGTGYTPIADNGTTVVQARPEFYGLKMFSLLSQGRVIPAAVSVPQNINFTAYGVLRTNGGISALLNNKDTDSSIQVTINLGTNVTTVGVMELTGTNLSSTNGFTLGGAPINPDGSWAGGYQSIINTTNGQLTILVPPISAILLDPVDTNSVPTNAIKISSIVYTNISGIPGFLLTWFAPSNDLFQVQWETNLSLANWNTFTNIVSYNTNFPANATNAQFNFFDDGSQSGGLGGTKFYRLLLLVATNTLTLPAQTNYIASVSQPLAVTNTATDSNSGATLNYQLTSFPTPSTVASINSNGIITWTPGAGDAGSAFKFLTTVTDNGLPPVTATNAFTVFVLPPPTFASVISTGTNVTLLWSAPTNDSFQVEWTTNLMPVIVWTPFPQIFTSPSGVFSFTDTNVLLTTKFYRLVWLPFP